MKVPVWGLKFWQLALSPGWPLTPVPTMNSVPVDPGGQEEELLAAASEHPSAQAGSPIPVQ